MTQFHRARAPLSPRSRRRRRLARRVVLPLAAAALLICLTLIGYARLGGAPVGHGEPYIWGGPDAYIAGDPVEGVYATCEIAPDAGDRRTVDIPGDADGLRLSAWFEGQAVIHCDRSVTIVTGRITRLYPAALHPAIPVTLAAIVAYAWYAGRPDDAARPTRNAPKHSSSL